MKRLKKLTGKFKRLIYHTKNFKYYFLNRETALNTVKTLLACGYIIEAPAHDVEEVIRKRLSGI